jgi:hypothetical protein
MEFVARHEYACVRSRPKPVFLSSKHRVSNRDVLSLTLTLTLVPQAAILLGCDINDRDETE